ncbi:MAG: DUF1501 domain-containing protein [Kiritimatiellaceae bacterium]|nr:DUF1501 domain-containing protein [Kiritimatiellaceae bacterium]
MMKRQWDSGMGLSRREALKLGVLGATGLGLAGNLPKVLGANSLLKAKAKSVIQVWLWGGPSHLDTFDPKPAAGYDYCGKYTSPISTNVDGIQLCQMLPRLAKMADKYSLLRGMTHGNNGHETASYMVMSGTKPAAGVVSPSMGAVVSLKKGYDAGYKGLIPPYITLTRPQGRFSEAGFLGARYQPFATGGDPRKTPFAVEGIVAKGISDQRQKSRRDLLFGLDMLGKQMAMDPLVAKMDQNQAEAYSLILGEAKQTFDLTIEPDKLREAYGRNSFLGQSCLQARKLVEVGVPFITINSNAWDTHKKHFESMQRMLPDLDRAVSSLITDLEERGLLESTIVWVGGEFGRSPKIQWDAPWNGGRGHYGKAFSHLVAGGGFQGGQVVGKTDEHGENVVDRTIYPWDLTASMYELFGIDPFGELPHPEGKQVYVSPLAMGDIETGGVLREIM